VEHPPRQSWTSTVRTVVFALMAAAILLGIVVGERAPFTSRLEPNKAVFLARGGDNMIRAYYLVVARGMPRGQAEVFLKWARDLYWAALEADPSDLPAMLSQAIVLRELGQASEVPPLLPPLTPGQFDEKTRRALGAVYALALSSYPSPQAVERSRDYLSRLAPGPLLTAAGYRANDKPDLAQATLRQAAKQAQPFALRFTLALAVNFLVVLSGILLLLSPLVRRRRPKPTAGPAGFPMSAAWGRREAVEALVLWVFLGIVLGSAAVSLAPMSGPPPTYLILAPSVLAAVLSVGWVWAVARFRAGFGWDFASGLRKTSIGMAVAGLAVLPVLGVHGVFQRLLNQSAADNPVLPLLVIPDTALAKAFLLVGVGLAAPALEETLFRGVLFGGLRRRWSFWPAALVSGAIFAVVHLDLAGFVAYALLGLVFAYLFERSRSLVAPWAAHAAFNVFNLVLVFLLFG
jgi:membrane protease YdiL (CAAX protease family)